MNKNAKQDSSLVNFRDALAKLREFVDHVTGSEIERAGVIQAFEFTYETCWRALQKLATDQGLVAASPRQALQAAFQLGWIRDSEQATWLQMIADRNLTTHTYRRKTADLVFDAIVRDYLPAFETLLSRI